MVLNKIENVLEHWCFEITHKLTVYVLRKRVKMYFVVLNFNANNSETNSTHIFNFVQIYIQM